jgi:hypothetical protein
MHGYQLARGFLHHRLVHIALQLAVLVGVYHNADPVLWKHACDVFGYAFVSKGIIDEKV